MNKIFNIGIQYIKEKTGNYISENDPAYDLAFEHFNLLKLKLNSFLKDINDLIESINNTILSLNELSHSFTFINKKFNTNVENLTVQFEKYSDRFLFLIHHEPFNQINVEINQKIELFQNKIIELEKIPEIRNKNQLLANSYKEKFEKYEKNNEIEKFEKFKIKFIEQQFLVNSISEKFILEINELWENRFIMIDEPLKEFISIIYNFYDSSMENFKNLNSFLKFEIE